MTNGRPLKPLLCGISLIVLLLFTASWIMTYNPDTPDYFDVILSQSHRALSYEIGNHRTAVFRVSPKEDQLEIVTNLDIYRYSDGQQAHQYEYALEVEILDSKNTVVSRETYWETTQRSQWIDPETTAPMASAFYINKTYVPADSRITTVFFERDRQEEIFVSLRLITPDQASAAVRAYRHVDMLKGRDLGTVRQISKRLKSNIARRNLYGEKTKDAEVQKYLRDVLSQVPAEGRSGIDYTTRDIFLYNRSIPILGEEPPESRLITLDHPLYLPFYGPAHLRVAFENGDRADIHIHREGDPSQVSLVEITPGKTFDKKFDSGTYLVEIRGKGEQVSIESISLDPPHQWLGTNQINPESVVPYRLTHYYRVQPDGSGDPVNIDLPGSSASHQPMKIVCRVPLEDQDGHMEVPFSLTYRFIDDAGEVILDRTYESTAYPSRFASYKSDDCTGSRRPSYPNRVFIQPPEHAVRMEFTSSRPLDTAFYCRIRSADVKVVYLNDDTTTDIRDFRFREEGATPDDWFYFKPVNASVLKENARHSAIMLPAGILERSISPVIETAGKVTVSHYPDLRADPDVIMEEIQHSPASDVPCYKEIEQRRDIQLTVVDSAEYGMNCVLKYFLTGNAPPLIRIGVDEDDTLHIRPVTKQGYITLPIMTRGNHRLHIESVSPQDRFFLRVDPAVQMDARACIGRSVYQLDGNAELTVPFRKPEWNSCGMNIILYTEQADSPFAVNVEMEHFDGMVPGRSAKQLTVRKRKYVVNDCGTVGSVFLSSGDNLSRTKTLYFPIHDDMPPGEYRLTITSDSVTPVYMRFFSLQTPVI
jgi:hypothetical protein